MLTVKDLSKSYGANKVLREVSFSVEKGERVALTGPSGSGKSTLLNCLAGIDRPDRGEILLDGESLTAIDEYELCRLRRGSVCTIFQFFHLLPTLSARENIAFPLDLLGLTEGEKRQRVEQLLEEVKLTSRATAFPDELSGGEQQRVAIARAVAARPRLLLADEPTGNLDSATGESILDLLESISEKYKVAMLVVTHSNAVARICRRTLRMRDGRIA